MFFGLRRRLFNVFSKSTIELNVNFQICYQLSTQTSCIRTFFATLTDKLYQKVKPCMFLDPPVVVLSALLSTLFAAISRIMHSAERSLRVISRPVRQRCTVLLAVAVNPCVSVRERHKRSNKIINYIHRCFGRISRRSNGIPGLDQSCPGVFVNTRFSFFPPNPPECC